MNKIINFSPLIKNCCALYYHGGLKAPKKPFWLGIAKTKISKVKQKKLPPENEDVEYKRLKEEYFILLNSVSNFIKLDNADNQTNKNFSKKLDPNFNKILKEKIKRSYLLNDKWNSEIAEERQKRIQAEMSNAFQLIKEEINSVEENKKNLQLRVDEIVKKEIEKSKFYITLENLEEEIEKSIKNVKDYNFALDLQGKKYEGSKHFKLINTSETDQ